MGMEIDFSAAWGGHDAPPELPGNVWETIAAGVTGARWQRRTVVALEGAMGRDAAVAEMLRRYLDLAAAGAPVHTWPEPANGVRPRAPA